MAAVWQQRNIRLPGSLLPAAELRFRFVAEDATAETGAVEAAIDDLEVTSQLDRCYPATGDAGAPDTAGGAAGGGGDKGCRCRMGGPEPARSGVVALLLILTAAGFARRRQPLRARAPLRGSSPPRSRG
jgi:MYXO-CTERM domain-containing protein